MTSDWVIIDYPINFANEINILLDNFVYSEYDDIEKIRSVLGRRHVKTIRRYCCATLSLDQTPLVVSTDLVRIGCLK